MSAPGFAHLYRFVNGLILGLFILLGVSGIVMLYGSWLPWLFDLHRMAGFALIAILPWKGIIVYRSLRRGLQNSFDRSTMLMISIVLALFVLVIIAFAVVWMWRLGPYSSYGQTLIAWHWIIGLLVVPILAFHAWRRWPSPRRRDFLSRRGFLQLLGVTAAGVVFGELAIILSQAQASADEPRRFTGSRGFGSFTGNAFPLTGESTVVLDPSQWRLSVSGAVRSPLVLTYADLLAKTAHTTTAIIDCTSGWYSIQDWQGIPLIDLLEQAGARAGAAGVTLFSATGYHHTYPIEEARTILLATHVSGQALAPDHGFPLRAVVPGRRGWFWVKWLSQIEVLSEPLQVIGGILDSPVQTLRQFK